ncbi:MULTISPECIES: tetratricopeptide repeat protein [Burkholderia]|uniref:tetratricopeptide repeat protein n=1 Tax=Burkholderia TaxID=32008 RepID=UPI0005723A8B|nr:MULTISPECIES: glycosyltransferase family 41 protein [Burkholderia]AOK45601.1 hypothetical protein WT60_01100 [Burkholderia sp. MSMB617WGS]KVG47536.1 hypothetical protein WS77_05225 [Burkholderia sp. MSMB0265]KVG82491.1 hypothetical protein WS81_01790 [Burkholderia sp. MSMB2040]KVG92732.1 hypothetical protein WS82_11075 [Burkholderia sp. MSMB2041]KVG98591.1 hypothetical protein WS83_28870 [Burkholderia sp. MSMB2042]KVK77106.1 hypothetical protein WS91_01525 [Burkholderia sp. MSMB1498]
MSAIFESSAPLPPEQQMNADIALVLQSALEHHHKGELEDARALYEAILGAQPEHADTRYNLAVLLVQTGSPVDALQHFEMVLGTHPRHGNYWVGYVNALIEAGQIAAAWTALNLAQQLGVKGPAVDTIVLRLAHSEEGRPAAVGIVPAATAAQAVPVAAETSETPEPHAGSARRPGRQEMSRAETLYDHGRDAEAAKAARTLTRRYPSHGPAWRVLGLALHRSGRYVEALEPLFRTTELLPDDSNCRVLYADTLRLANRLPEAESQCREAIARNAGYAEAHRVLGVVLAAIGRQNEAIEAGKRAIEIAPDSATAYGSLAVTLFEGGLLNEAEQYFRRAFELDPRDTLAHSNLLFNLTHRIDIDIDAHIAAHRDYAAHHEAPLKAAWPRHANRRDPQRRLRIGFVSGDLFDHAVASYLLPLVEHLVKDPALSLTFYHNYVRDDRVTARLRACSHAWHTVAGLTDAQFVNRIRADGIDILVDLSGHSGRNRLSVFARKPAPVQVSWIGYPATTGLDAIDYYFTDSYAVPFGPMEAQYTEKIVHLSSGATFSPATNAPPVNMLPALHNGRVTFGSFNRLNKLRADVIAVWARVMRAVPDSRIVVGSMPGDEDRLEIGKTLTSWFAREGIARDRLVFQPRTTTTVYLQQHHHVDFCLDTFPYTGSTTVLNALWMGVPTLTMRGKTPSSRAGLTWMSHVGLESFVADDVDDFVAKGIALASDVPTLARIRGELRERCARSAAFQPQRVAQDVSDALRIMWRRWCDGQPPAPFAVPPRDATTTVAGDRP